MVGYGCICHTGLLGPSDLAGLSGSDRTSWRGNGIVGMSLEAKSPPTLRSSVAVIVLDGAEGRGTFRQFIRTLRANDCWLLHGSRG